MIDVVRLIDEVMDGVPIARLVTTVIDQTQGAKHDDIRLINSTMRNRGLTYSEFMGHPHVKETMETKFGARTRSERIAQVAALVRVQAPHIEEMATEVVRRRK